MKRVIYAKAFVALAVFATSAAGQTPVRNASAAGETDPHRAMLMTYCATCHNTRLKTGGIAFDSLDLQAAPDDAQIWEKALRKLRGHLMPPPGAPQPPQKDVDLFVTWMEKTLDAHPKGPKAGHVPVQRLNRTEYVAAVKDLVGVDVKAKDVLPQDIEVEGLDNIAAVLSVSPSFLDQYIDSARKVASLAVGSPSPRVSNVKYFVAANQNGDEPMPPGTRGGVKFKHNFPADGEYRINILDLSVGLYTNTMENESTLVVMIDGRIVFRKPIGGAADGDTPQERASISHQTGSILDLILDRTKKLQGEIGGSDKAALHGYLESVREIERRAQMAGAKNLSSLKIPNAPIGELDAFDEQVKLMFDLIALAYQADLTRVTSYIMVSEGTNRTYNHIGVPDAFHPVSHHANDLERIDKLVKIQTWHVEKFAEFIKKMAETPDGQGTLLDHSIFMYGSNMSNSDLHNNYPEPNILVGGGNGKMKLGGQHLLLPERTPIANLHLTVLQKAGVQRDKFGDSTGTIAGV